MIGAAEEFGFVGTISLLTLYALVIGFCLYSALTNRDRFGSLQLTLHFHNTRGMGLANVLASVQEGMDRFDGSLGGLGGCPYAPGATGNICSEDAIHMLHAMGFDTGIDMPRLLAVARRLPALVGHEVPGQVAKAGLITDLHPAPPGVAELRSQGS